MADRKALAERLEPCPFCGSDDIGIHTEGHRGMTGDGDYVDGWARCRKCLAEIDNVTVEPGPNIDGHAMARDRTIERWNRRAAATALREEGEPEYCDLSEQYCPLCGEEMLDDRDGMTGARWFCASGHRAIIMDIRHPHTEEPSDE